MLKILYVILAAGMLLSQPADAASKKTKNAAAAGAGVGLVTGGVSGAAKGAVIGGGAGACANAEKGDKANKEGQERCSDWRRCRPCDGRCERSGKGCCLRRRRRRDVWRAQGQEVAEPR